MPDLISDLAISEYLEALASKSATPGGGSASALIAAQGTALLSMVCEFSRPSDESLLQSDWYNAVFVHPRRAEPLTLE